MTNTTENSFGARLRRAQDLLSYIQGFSGYNPPRTQETVAAFTTLINNIIAANTAETNNNQQFKVAVDNRQMAFKGAPNSVEKLLAPIKGAVDAQFGKKSRESGAISSAIKKLRAQKLIKPTLAAKEKEESKTVSSSERSFGSMTQHFNDIINTLSQFTGYNPNNATLRIPTLQAHSLTLTALNNTVAQRIQVLKVTRNTRNIHYTDLNDRVQRIKSYVKAQYGINSNEYKLIKGIKV